MIRDLKGKVEDKIPINNVLISVFDKSGLEELIPALIELNEDIRFMSTGGTYKKIDKILNAQCYSSSHLIQVSDYTEFPEMEGGLVKTIHPKIHAGILGERNNPAHQEYIRNLTKTINFLDDGVERVFDAEVGKKYKVEVVNGITGVYLDLVVANLYPFEEIVKKIKDRKIDKNTGKPFNFESARGNIDIGGTNMIRAAGKNFPSCAVLCDLNDYKGFLEKVESKNGHTTFDQRKALMPKVFEMTGNYDKAIAKYTASQGKEVREQYEFVQRGK